MEAINVIIRNVTPLTYDVLQRMMETNVSGSMINLHSYEGNNTKALSLNEANLVIVYLGNNAHNEWTFVRRVRAQHPELPVLIWGERTSLELLRSTLDHEVHGLITDEDSSAMMFEAINALASGQKHFDQEQLIQLTHADGLLSKKEETLLTCIAQELTRFDIAKQLKLSVRTVDLMLKTLREKIGVPTNIGLALYAKKVGLV